MNIEQAKTIRLTDYMSKIGFTPIFAKHGGNDLWYIAPIRNETEPSFHIHVAGNLWYDQGEGTGGKDVVSLAQYYLRNATVSEALSHLDELFYYGSFIPYVKKEIIKADEIKNIYIKDMSIHFDWHYKYLQDRRISKEVGLKYLRNVQYKNTTSNKIRYGLGFKNSIGGWELRHYMEADNTYQKSSIVPKGMTFIQGVDNTIVDIFEGFSDFLPYLTNCSKNGLIPDHSTIVLNSLSFHRQAAQKMITRLKAVDNTIIEVRTFFDNHSPGYDAANYIKEALNIVPVSVISMNDIYKGCEDLGAWVIENF